MSHADSETARVDRLKHVAALRAVDLVQPGMVLGLGTGSTAGHAVREIAARLTDGRLRDIVGVPTSERTRALAAELGVPLTTLNDRPKLDLALDGADEISPNLDLIKGAGGALLREKMVAFSAATFVVFGDASKRVRQLGERARIPVEVVRFGWACHLQPIRDLGGEPELRLGADAEPFVTDEGHFILDCRFGVIKDPRALAASLRARPGVVETGLFLGLARIGIVGTDDGPVVLERA